MLGLTDLVVCLQKVFYLFCDLSGLTLAVSRNTGG